MEILSKVLPGAMGRPGPGGAWSRFALGLLSRLTVIAGSIFGVCFGVEAEAAPLTTDNPYVVKAAFLLNFAKYVEWPESAFAATDSPIRIGVLGQDPFGTIIDETVRERTVNGRSVQIVRLASGRDFDGGALHVLYIAPGLDWKNDPMRARVAGAPVLVVADSARLFDEGAMVAFRTLRSRLSFEVSEGAALNAGLRIGSRMLEAAVDVRERRPRETAGGQR